MICWETITHFLGPSVLFGWVEWADRAEWTFYNQSAFRQTNFLKCSVCQMCRKSSSLTKQSICSTHDFKSNIYIHDCRSIKAFAAHKNFSGTLSDFPVLLLKLHKSEMCLSSFYHLWHTVNVGGERDIICCDQLWLKMNICFNQCCCCTLGSLPNCEHFVIL